MPEFAAIHPVSCSHATGLGSCCHHASRWDQWFGGGTAGWRGL